MTNILLFVLAVIGVFVLVGVSVYFAVKLKDKLCELETKIAVADILKGIKEEAKAQPGSYGPVKDISSMHPNVFRPYYSFSSSPDSYDYRLRNIDIRVSNLETELLDNDNDDELTLLERVKNLEDRIGENDIPNHDVLDSINNLEERIDGYAHDLHLTRIRLDKAEIKDLDNPEIYGSGYYDKIPKVDYYD